MTDNATATMIANLPERTGRSLDEWLALLATAGLSKHGEIVAYLKTTHGVSHGFANLIAHRYRATDADGHDPADLVDAQYQGAKAALRPLYEQIVARVLTFGDDITVAPKKTYVALRRGKQFALIQPAARTRIDVGLNLGGEPATERMRAATGMCTHKIAVANADEIDDELMAKLRLAYERA